MDRFERNAPTTPAVRFEDARKAMGLTRVYAEKIELAKMTPCDELTSTKFCLANPDSEYLVYLPVAGEVTVDLTKAAGQFTVEWMHRVSGEVKAGETVAGGAQQHFTTPFTDGAVLYLHKAVAK